jgi:hypothetical protein
VLAETLTTLISRVGLRSPKETIRAITCTQVIWVPQSLSRDTKSSCQVMPTDLWICLAVMEMSMFQMVLTLAQKTKVRCKTRSCKLWIIRGSRLAVKFSWMMMASKLRSGAFSSQLETMITRGTRFLLSFHSMCLTSQVFRKRSKSRQNWQTSL